MLADFPREALNDARQAHTPKAAARASSFLEGRAVSEGSAPPPTSTDRLRDFGLGAQVLADLGCGKIRLITNNPRRLVGASGYGLDIAECLPMWSAGSVVALRERTG